MAEFYYCPKQVKQQIIQNLVEAGALVQDEIAGYLHRLDKLDSKDLIAVLLESHNLREQRFSEHGSLYRYFLVDMMNIGHN